MICGQLGAILQSTFSHQICAYFYNFFFVVVFFFLFGCCLGCFETKNNALEGMF